MERCAREVTRQIDTSVDYDKSASEIGNGGLWGWGQHGEILKAPHFAIGPIARSRKAKRPE
jgi:hypothetical protein